MEFPKEKLNMEHSFTEELIHRLKDAESKIKEYEKKISQTNKSQQKQLTSKKKSKNVISVDDDVYLFLSIF